MLRRAIHIDRVGVVVFRIGFPLFSVKYEISTNVYTETPNAGTGLSHIQRAKCIHTKGLRGLILTRIHISKRGTIDHDLWLD